MIINCYYNYKQRKQNKVKKGELEKTNEGMSLFGMV